MEQRRKPMISANFSYLPLEETLQITPKKERLFIGIPREDSFPEKRIALTPTAVQILINNGHEVWIEQNAGESSFYFDTDYSEAGAKICYNKQELYKANIILKTAPISLEEIEYTQAGQLIISPIHLPSLSIEEVNKLITKKVTCIALGSIRDNAGNYPIVRSMSEIAGAYAILNAAKYLSNNHDGKGILLGGVSGVPPAQVLILGAGIVGEQAARAALGLGAIVKVFDNSIYRLSRLQKNIGTHIYTSVLDTSELGKQLCHADVVVGALKPINGITPMVVSDDMVSHMKAGSVIIDVSIDCGGCFETSRITTHENPIFKKYDVIHYCVPNMASGVARTASMSISNVLMPLLMECSEKGGHESIISFDSGFRNGVYLFNGLVTSETIAKKFNLKHTSLNLITPSNQ